MDGIAERNYRYLMRVQDWVRIFAPLIVAFGISETGWLYAIIFQRDQPVSRFQKTVTKYASIFVLGMGYLVLWQYEVDAALRMRGAWQGLLAIWAIAMIWLTVRSFRWNAARPASHDMPGNSAADVRKEIETLTQNIGKPK